MPDIAVLRRFLAANTSQTVVEIETADLVALCDAAERGTADPLPRVPALFVLPAGAAA